MEHDDPNKWSQWRGHEGSNARAICPSLTLAPSFQFIPEIWVVGLQGGHKRIFVPKYEPISVSLKHVLIGHNSEHLLLNRNRHHYAREI